MEINYKTKKLEKSLTNDKELSKTYGNRAKKIKQRLGELKSADNLLTIKKLPALRLHFHIGDGQNVWSIDIQANWRILFLLDHDPIPILADGGIDLKEITAIKIISISDPH